MATVNRVIKNTGFLYAKMGITMFISLYTTRLILNSMGAEDFGIFNIIGGAIAMLGFLNTAMAGTTQRFMSFTEGEGDKEKQKKIFNISFVLHFVIAIIMGSALIVAGWFFFNGILNIAPERIYAAKVVYASLIISTVFTVMTVPYDAVINAHENMFYYAIVGILESLLKLGAALAIVHAEGDKLVLFGILMAVIPIVTMSLMRIYCHRHYVECIIAPKQFWDKKLMKEMTVFAGWNFSSTSTSMIGNYGVGVLLNHFFGAKLNASFGIAAQLNGQLVSFSNNMMKALNPSIVKAEGGGERKNMIKLSLYGCKFSFFLFSIFTIPFLIETPIILKLWLKNTPEWAVVFCRLAIARTMLEQLTSPLNTAIGAHGKIKSFIIVKSILFMIPLPVIYFLFKNGFPAYTMLIVTLIIGGVLDGANSIYFAMKKCELNIIDYIKIVLNKTIPVFIFSFLIGLIPVFFIEESALRFILVLTISMISFLIFFITIGLTKYERNEVCFFARKFIITKLKK